MSIISELYFKGDINLPQVANQYQIDDVIAAINQYEPEIMTRLLGYNLWKLTKAAWEDSIKETDPVPLPTRFDELINGVEFTFQYNGHTITDKWNGLRNEELISLIAYYVYFKYRNNTENHTSTTGEISTEHEYASNRNARPKMVYSWNRMIDLYGQTPKPYNLDLRSKKEVREHFLTLSNYRHYNINASAYNFLLAKKSTYPEWIFEPAYKINSLGI